MYTKEPVPATNMQGPKDKHWLPNVWFQSTLRIVLKIYFQSMFEKPPEASGNGDSPWHIKVIIQLQVNGTSNFDFIDRMFRIWHLNKDTVFLSLIHLWCMSRGDLSTQGNEPYLTVQVAIKKNFQLSFKISHFRTL